MEVLEACNLCSSRVFVPYADKKGESTRRLFHVVRCLGCGLVFVNPRLTESENAALYDEAYFNGQGFDATVNYVKLFEDGDRTRDGENRGILDKVRALRPEDGLRILDVGCGTGSLLGALARAGYRNVVGLELSEYAADIARKSSGCRVLVGDVLTSDFGSEQFDVVNATEVIEHVRDPMAFFRRLKGLLRPNGLFIYSTGNCRSVYARMTGRYWGYLHPEGHLFYFSPSTLGRYFETVGLTPLWPDRLHATLRRQLARAEGDIMHSQIVYVGTSSRGLGGVPFRTAGAIPQALTGWALAAFGGRLTMPLAVNAA